MKRTFAVSLALLVIAGCATGQSVASGTPATASLATQTVAPTPSPTRRHRVAIAQPLASTHPGRPIGGRSIYIPAVCGPRGSVREGVVAGWLH